MAAVLPSSQFEADEKMFMVAAAADRDNSPACGGEAAEETALEDLPGDVLALVLRRLDGASLAALGCASSAFRSLAADPLAWRDLCLAAFPSSAAAPFSSCRSQSQHRALFADAFPFPSSSPSPAPAAPAAAMAIPRRLVSAVDLWHGGKLIMSRVVETDATSSWFLGSPFRIDALQQEGFTAPNPISPAELSLTWVLLDPATGRAVNASSRKPVAVDRSWLTGETVARFTLVFVTSGGEGDSMCAVEAAVACDDRFGHVREVSLSAEDGDGGGVSGRDAVELVAAAMAAPRCRGGGVGVGAAVEEAKRRYGEFVKGKSARKEWKARREGLVDLCCSGVGAAAFLGFILMLTLR
ncbi:probable F-box protein At2g36090 [Brachypodium distachyon]|nr:probable F-box protein At2g36090 [Brachypodium distachyon]|eukprot:XP_003576302.1 probable F-box protein At2g36090 [Brachypodium distachyon]